MIDDIRKVAIVGTGVIGAGWATHFLAKGFDVIAADPAPDAEPHLREFIKQAWSVMDRLGVAQGATPERLTFVSNVADAVREADFIQENGPERIEIKQALIAEIEAAAPEGTIIASSSSGLPVSDMQAHARHPERIVLGHPFNPPHLIPLVEVGGGARTASQAIDTAIAFYAKTGKKPIRIRREVKGHIANRLQVALWREAINLVIGGVASVADIDTAIAHGPGLRWALLGPFLNLHASGGPGGITHVLEHLGPAQREWARDLGSYPETDDYIAPIAAGVEQELTNYDFKETLSKRDELLVDLLLAKKTSSKELP